MNLILCKKKNYYFILFRIKIKLYGEGGQRERIHYMSSGVHKKIMQNLNVRGACFPLFIMHIA